MLDKDRCNIKIISYARLNIYIIVERKYYIKITNIVTKFYLKYKNIISLNKNLFISGIAGFIASIIIVHVFVIQSMNHFINSTLTVVIGYITAKAVFIILFHLDNKKTYTKRLTGKIDQYILKQIVKKMIVANFIFDFTDNFTRFVILFELLKMLFPPGQAVLLSSIVSSSLSYLTINLIVKRMNVFGFTKKK